MTVPVTPEKRFISPYDDAAPVAAEGWQDLYPYYLLFREDRREIEEGKFWFADFAHWPHVFRPFDTIMVEFASRCLGQYNTRHYLVPPANGVDYRVHNGYCYMNPVAVPEADIPARVPVFLERAGHYYANWDSLLENWHGKMRRVIADLEAIDFQPLPDKVPDEWITEGRGLDNSFYLIGSFNRAIELCYEAWQYHFEFLNLGYAAYLDFFGFCKEAFPGVSDLGIAKMVQGIEVDLFKPDDELRRLAKLAVELDVADALASGGVDEALAAVAARPRGEEWLAAWEGAKDPWFNFSSGNGFYSTDLVWLDHLEIPLGFLRDYMRARAGRGGHRPADGGDRRRARPHHRGVPRAAARRRGAGGVRREAGPLAAGVPLRGEPQLLRRALGAVGVLAQDPRARRRAGWRGLLGATRTTSSTCAATSSSRCSTTTATGGPPAPSRSARTTGRRRSRAGAASSTRWGPRRRRPR